MIGSFGAALMGVKKNGENTGGSGSGQFTTKNHNSLNQIREEENSSSLDISHRVIYFVI